MSGGPGFSLCRGGTDGDMGSRGLRGGPVVGGFCCVLPLCDEVHLIYTVEPRYGEVGYGRALLWQGNFFCPALCISLYFCCCFLPGYNERPDIARYRGGGGGALGVALWHRSGPERWNSIVLDLGGVGVSYLGRASSVIFVVPVTSLWRGSTVPYYT